MSVPSTSNPVVLAKKEPVMQVGEWYQLEKACRTDQTSLALRLIDQHQEFLGGVNAFVALYDFIEIAIRKNNTLLLERLLKIAPAATWELYFDHRKWEIPFYYAVQCACDADILRLLIKNGVKCNRPKRERDTADLPKLIEMRLAQIKSETLVSGSLYDRIQAKLLALSISEPDLKTLLDAPKIPAKPWEPIPVSSVPSKASLGLQKSAVDKKSSTEKISQVNRIKKIQAAFRRFRAKKQRAMRQVQWMTGSNGNFVLPGLKTTDNTLIPTGQLHLMGIAPIGGAQDEGVRVDGINQTALSGVRANKFSVAWGYAKTGPRVAFKELEAGLVKYLETIHIPELLTLCGKRGALAHLGIINAEILKLRQLNEPLFQEKFSKVMELLLNIVNTDAYWFEATENSAPIFMKNALERQRQLFRMIVSKEPCYRLSETDKKTMSEQTPFPIIFSSTLKLPVSGTSEGAISERNFYGCLKLGDQLDVLITDQQHERSLRQFLRERKLRDKVFVCTEEEFTQQQALASTLHKK